MIGAFCATCTVTGCFDLLNFANSKPQFFLIIKRRKKLKKKLLKKLKKKPLRTKKTEKVAGFYTKKHKVL